MLKSEVEKVLISDFVCSNVLTSWSLKLLSAKEIPHSIEICTIP